MKHIAATAAATALAVASSLTGLLQQPITYTAPAAVVVSLPSHVVAEEETATTSPEVVASSTPPETVQDSPQQEEAPKVAPETVKQKIARYAKEYGVNEGIMTFTVSCETGGTFDAGIQSNARYTFSDASRGIVKGERERSYGLAQIHLPDNPGVTHAQATDADFSLRFLARALSRGEFWRWSCLVK